ncbi:MAG: DNA polymerase III subunit beta [Halobacteriovoraceae bacterium]|nr:DNA polymerase III subunit beta [Halobacteriovoraceae bacterium]
MKILTTVDRLKEAAGYLVSITDKKNIRPNLGYTWVVADKNKLIFSATDLEISAKVVTKAQVEGRGEFCINIKNLHRILRELSSGDMEMEVLEENLLKLHFSHIHYSLLIYRNIDPPPFKWDPSPDKFTLRGKDVLKIIDKTSHAISYDETRPFLNGIYLQQIDRNIRAVATDGYRLSLLETETQSISDGLLVNGVIVPRRGVLELKKMAEAYKEDIIEFSVDESFLYANAHNDYLISVRLVAREFPKYQSRIPGKTAFTLKASRDALYDAFRRIRVMSNEKSGGVSVKLEKNNMSIKAKDPSAGDARETLPVDYNGKEMEIFFKANYLVDTLGNISEGDVTLELNNEFSAVVVKTAGDPHYLGIIMPLML